MVSDQKSDFDEECFCISRHISLPEQEAKQGTLRNRAGREWLVCALEPGLSRSMMNVINVHKSNQDIGVKERCHSVSSMNRLTSSEVIVRPKLIVGNPVTGLRSKDDGRPSPRPRRMRKATA
jgi:hypothetical protein